MYIPNQFLPSRAQKVISYDEEGRLREFNISRQSTGGIGVANRLYATEAEEFTSVTPFLKASMKRDAGRRNYIVQPGGKCIYFGDHPAVAFADPWSQGEVNIPDQKEHFGHYGAEVLSPGTQPHNQSFRVGGSR